MSGAEIARVSERALLVRFHDVELDLSVAKAQALGLEAKKLEAERQRIERLSLKGKDQDEAPLAQELWSAAKGEDESRAKDQRLSLKGKDEGRTSLRRVVLGAGSLLVELHAQAGAGEIERFAERLGSLVKSVEREFGLAGAPTAASVGYEHRVAAKFGGDDGPDLAAVAVEAGLSVERVVELVCRAELRVAFVGFAPGFPYLIGLPRELEVARLASPRARVPAGSIAIAGPFAGVYPSATPGGWRLLGRLADGEAPLFDPLRSPPARFAAGDRVRFVDATGESAPE